MAACGRLQHIFENPLPETFLESLSPWKAIKSMKPVENCTFQEIFGELHFKERNRQHVVVVDDGGGDDHSSSSSPLSESMITSSLSSSSSSSIWRSSSSSSVSQHSPLLGDGIENSPTSNNNNVNNIDGERSKSPVASSCCYYPATTSQKKHDRHSDSFSSMNSESLSLCTEGLGFESCDDVEDLGNSNHNEAGFNFQTIHNDQEKVCLSRQSSHPPAESFCSKRSRTNKGATFPPPISCIGRTGKPWVCFKSYRQDGRFILQQIRFPIQEFLHACREDGRLRLQYIQSDDEILEGDEDEEEDDDDDDSFDDIKDVNEEKISNDLDDDEDHEHQQDDVADDKAVHMGINNVQDDSSE